MMNFNSLLYTIVLIPDWSGGVDKFSVINMAIVLCKLKCKRMVCTTTL